MWQDYHHQSLKQFFFKYPFLYGKCIDTKSHINMVSPINLFIIVLYRVLHDEREARQGKTGGLVFKIR